MRGDALDFADLESTAAALGLGALLADARAAQADSGLMRPSITRADVLNTLDEIRGPWPGEDA